MVSNHEIHEISIQIGLNVNGQVEQLLMNNGVKKKCPADQQYSYWLVSTLSGYEPDSSLMVQCVGM